jgi:hypothetical protein
MKLGVVPLVVMLGRLQVLGVGHLPMCGCLRGDWESSAPEALVHRNE